MTAGARVRPRFSPGLAAAELLVLLGVTGLLFAFWQGVWTDVTAGRQQQSIIDELAWDPPASVAAAGSDTLAPPVLPAPDEGSVFATMQIPRFGADYVRPVAEGIDRRAVLNTVGLGHYPGTAMPGQVGNFAVAGHRVTYGKPLNQIADLEPGDPIVVRVADSAGFDWWYVYSVTTSRIVDPSQVEVIAPVPGHPDERPTGRHLTLTACHPMWSLKERYIVHADLSYALPASAGTPVELSPEAP